MADASAADAAPPELTSDERAAVRAYLQRTEMRIATVHRVAAALLSGAGLMVLLPTIERDSVVSVLRTLLTGDADAPELLLVVCTVAALVVPFAALWMVLRDLTQFYFHANQLRHEGGESFTPRFTLTGLMLPSDELGPKAAAMLDRERGVDQAIAVLVPLNDAARTGIDQRIEAYGGLGTPATRTDRARADALQQLTASQSRPILEEVAKIEYGLTRHVLRIQVIVLRYVKALLALLTTALAVFAAAAVVAGKGQLSTGDLVWLSAIFLVWSPTVVVAVQTPVRWLERQLRGEGATHTAVSADRELTGVEDLTVRVAVVGLAAAIAAMVATLVGAEASTPERTIGCAAILASVAATTILVVRRRHDRIPPSWPSPPPL